jgi:ATP-dependent protease ClpP protease subunit
MTGHVFIYGEVGPGLGKASLQSVKAQLDKEKSADEIVVHLVSPGGDVFEGFGIYNLLKNSGKKIVTHIEGLTASIATLIAFAGERIIMNKTAQFMIHNPSISDLKGDARDLRNMATQLDKIKALLIDVSERRAARNGKSISKEQLAELYDNETWLTSDEAVNRGFVDEVVDAIKAVAKVDLNNLKMNEKENRFIALFKSLFGLKKFKNDFTETLADGTVIVVLSDDEDWTGKQIVRQEDGAPLDPGDYTLTSGKVITVGENSTIATVTEAPTPDDAQKGQQKGTETPEDMKKIEELQAQLAAEKEARAAAEAKANATTEATAALAAKFENFVKAQEEEKKKTVGKVPATSKGPVFANVDDSGNAPDPLVEFFKQATNRN